MFTEYLDYTATGFFSKTVLDYLESAPELETLYNLKPAASSLLQAIDQQAKRSVNRPVLVSVLKEQYARITAAGGKVSPLVSENIELLEKADTYTVTTGHQLNIFTGPLYTIYKIVGTIKAARELSSQTHKVIPVFWMATEDHDFAEINHLNIGDKTVSWDMDALGAVGRLDIKSIQPALGKVLSSIGVSPFLPDIEQICRNAYLKNKNLADASRYFYNELFGAYGLVILDADEAKLKKEFAGIMEDDILNQHSFPRVSQSNALLEAAGYHVQVHPREINFFYLQNSSRERIIREGAGFKVLNTSIHFTREEIQAEIAAFPERFSPNVIMRPLYQEAILPNLAYIGGGAEVSYWLSIRSTFEKLGVPYPILLLRNSAMLVDQVSHKRAEKLGFETSDLFKDTREQIRNYVKRSSEKVLDFEAERIELRKIYKAIEVKAGDIDPTLSESTRAMMARSKKMLDKLESKMFRAEKDKFDTEMSQIFKINQKLFPNHTLQERVENFLPYYARLGPALFDILLESFDPFGKQMTVINL